MIKKFLINIKKMFTDSQIESTELQNMKLSYLLLDYDTFDVVQATYKHECETEEAFYAEGLTMDLDDILYLTIHKMCDTKDDLGNCTSLKRMKYDSHQKNFQCNLSHISSLTTLERLIIRNCDDVDISQITNLYRLKTLKLYRTDIIDSSYLQYLTNLETLEYNVRDVSDLEPLRELKNLKTLCLTVNKEISDDIVSQYVSNMPMLKKFDIIRV